LRAALTEPQERRLARAKSSQIGLGVQDHLFATWTLRHLSLPMLFPSAWISWPRSGLSNPENEGCNALGWSSQRLAERRCWANCVASTIFAAGRQLLLPVRPLGESTRLRPGIVQESGELWVLWWGRIGFSVLSRCCWELASMDNCRRSCRCCCSLETSLVARFVIVVGVSESGQ